jgi:hypothetical protein
MEVYSLEMNHLPLEERAKLNYGRRPLVMEGRRGKLGHYPKSFHLDRQLV